MAKLSSLLDLLTMRRTGKGKGKRKMEMDLRAKIGQMLMTGISSTEVTQEFERLVEAYQIGNVILFDRNIESTEQLRRLCREIQEVVQRHTGHMALIAIDQEGGAVSRMPEDAVNMPGAMALAATGNPGSAYEAGRFTGEELRSMGVNFNLAPVVDINTNPANPVIGSRSFGDTPETVIRYSLEMIRGLQEGGVLCAVKHFPGHGDTAVDSHVGLPVAEKTLAELEETELRPFAAAVAAGVDAVMTTHILFPGLEPEQIPGTMSRAVLSGLLRRKMGFQGMIITDCMEMGAVAMHYGTAAGACRAAAAGADMLCISHTSALAAETAGRTYEAVCAGELPQERIEDAAAHVLACKRRAAEYAARPLAVDFAAGRRLAERLVRESLTLVRGQLFPLGDNPLFLGCYAYRSTLASSSPDQRLSFAGFMQERFGGRAAVTAVDPKPEEIDRCVALAAGHDCVVIGTYNGHMNRGQIDLANRICRETEAAVMVAALRDPYDIALIDERACCVAAYAYSRQCFTALADALAGQESMRGLA